MTTQTNDTGIQSVLFATDFSENASPALRRAVTIARAHHATVTILHVAPAQSMEALPAGFAERVSKRLQALEADVRELGVEATGCWEAGKPWERICAEAEGHDLVVIGARGHASHMHLPLGSTADRVLRSATVPVLTVHHEDDARQQMPNNVLVATDFSESASMGLANAVRIFATSAGEPLHITLLHAWQPLADYADMDAPIPLPNPYVTTEMQATEMLEAAAARARSERVLVTTVVRCGYPAKMVEEEAAAINADLVALGTHGLSGLARFMLGSVAERVVHRVHCPVLTVGLAAVSTDHDSSSDGDAVLEAQAS